MAAKPKTRGQKLVTQAKRQAAKASVEGKEHIKRNLFGRLKNIRNVRLLIFEWCLLVSALILLAVTQSFWFVDSYAEEAYTTGGTYSEGTIGSVNSLNPIFAVTSSEKALSRLLFSTLTTIDYSGHPGLGLAESIVPSENGQVWTLRLREGLKWSDGQPITNDDVIWTVETIRNPIVKSIYDSNLYNVDVAENENGEIVFTLPRPYADFTSALAIPVLPKHILEDADLKNLVEDEFSKNPVTSGPFTYNAMQLGSTTEEKVYYLASNPDYYGGQPYLQSFAIHTYPDHQTLISALNSGAITATAELTDAESSQITNPQLMKKNATTNYGVYLFFNTDSPLLASKDMRAAIAEGLDMETIRAASPDTTALDYPLLRSQLEQGHFPALSAYDFNDAKAKISELTGGATEGTGTGTEVGVGASIMGVNGANDINSGINNGAGANSANSTPDPADANRPALEIATINTGYLPAVASAVAAELRDLGFNTNVTVYEEQNQDFITKRAYDILIFEIGLGADPDLLPYYHSSHATNSGLNLSNYKSALVDDLLLGAREGLDESLRTKKYNSFLNYWVSDVPAIGLFRSNLTYFYNRNARTFGYDINLVDSLDRFIDVNNWAVNKATKDLTP